MTLTSARVGEQQSLLLLLGVCYLAAVAQGEAWSIAVLSDMHIGESAYQTQLAQEAVAAINGKVAEENIKFVVITGDVSNTGLPAQMLEAREILDGLSVPYLPTFGNHDVWIYNSTMDWEEEVPTGDRLFSEVFAAAYADFPYGELTYVGDESTWDDFLNITCYFQNWRLDLDGMTFFGLDWNTRGHAATRLGYLGAMPGCRLHNFTNGAGGTFPFLDQQLAAVPASNASNIVLFQHHPFSLPPLVPEPLYGFSTQQKDQIRASMQEHHAIDQYWGVVAGHMHIWWNGTAFPWQDEWASFWQWETCACKRSAAFSIVTIEHQTVQGISKNYGDGQRHSDNKYLCGETIPDEELHAISLECNGAVD